MESRFADFCRTLRKRKGLTQKQLAEKAALSLRTVVYWETGEREPRSEELQRALQVLDATASEIEHAYLLQTTRRGIALARHQVHGNAIEDGRDVLIPDLGDLLVAIRMRHGWSSERLAQEMKVNRSTIVRWERMEQLPAEENLNRLCTLLKVYPAERFALLTRRLLPPLWQQQTSLDSCVQRIQRFCDSTDQMGTALIDLHAITLKRELYLTARFAPHFKVFMARIDAFHGKWLLYQDRIREATACAERALNLVAGQKTAYDFLHLMLNLAACCAGMKQADGTEKSLRLLRQWQPGVANPDVRLLVCCDMAYYAAHAGYHEAAMQILCATHRLKTASSFLENRAMYYNTTYARMLARVGRPYEALDLLPTLEAPGLPSLFYTFLRAEMCLDAGEHDEAQRYIDFISMKLERYPIRLLQQRTNQLAARL